LAYTIKRIYAPFAVQAIQDGNYTKVFIVNDHTTAVDATVSIKLLSLADAAESNCTAESWATEPIDSASYTVPAGFASMVWSMKTFNLLNSRHGCSSTSCYLSVEAIGTLVRSDLGITNPREPQEPLEPDALVQDSQYSTDISQTQMWFAPLKDIDLPDPKLLLTDFAEAPQEVPGAHGTADHAHAATSTPVSFTLRSSRPAALTMLATKLKGRFSEDALTAVHPCEPRKITFFPKPGVTVSPEELEAALSVESLFDHQYGAVAAPAPALPAS
jgi:hypothetical protein